MTNFTLGQQVTNCSMIATVVGFHIASGILVLKVPGTGKWLADPEKTQEVPGPMIHKDDLVTI